MNSTESTPRILIVDDEPSICWGLQQLCTHSGFDSRAVASVEAALELAAGNELFDAIVTDVRLPGIDGLSALPAYQRQFPDVPVIVITAFGDLRTAIDAIQKGAFEYIVKPFELPDVKKVLEQAVAIRRLRQRPDQNSTGPTRGREELRMVGSSPVMQEIYKQIALTTTTRAPVLITGESGTGKELIARSIHQFGSSPQQPFVTVNIAAINPTLMETELFGSEDKAIANPEIDRNGLIEQANGGTLFLDEVAELPLEIQIKLLRVLDTGEIDRAGSTATVRSNFRLITATNQDLLTQVNHGDFRHDLFYRLRTYEIKLPPLRDRKEDIPELTRYFLSRLTDGARGDNLQIDESFFRHLGNRFWKGNVRELQSVVERAAILARGGILTAAHIEDFDPATDSHSSTAGQVHDIKKWVAQWTRDNWNERENDQPLYEALLEIIEPAIFSTAFELSGNQYSAAARKLGIHRTTLKKKLSPGPESRN